MRQGEHRLRTHVLVVPVRPGVLKAVISKISATLHRKMTCSIEVCILGLFARPKARKMGNTFIDRAMSLAKRPLSMTWKNTKGTGVAKWEADLGRS